MQNADMITLHMYLEEMNERYKPFPQFRRDHLSASAPEVQMALGLAEEVGEVLGVLKKSWMYGKPLDQEALMLEMGDVFHNFIRLADMYGLSLYAIMEQNAKKLRARPVEATGVVRLESEGKPPYHLTERQLFESLMKTRGEARVVEPSPTPLKQNDREGRDL